MDGVRVEGASELRRRLLMAGDEHPKMLRKAGLAAASVVVASAKPRVPVLTGAARGSLRALATPRGATVKGGGARVPYYGWLEFGGRVGKYQQVHRPRVREGRYLRPALKDRQLEVFRVYEVGVRDILRRANLI